eukprot:1567108-Pleurochrysis_carterae.AAC.2
MGVGRRATLAEIVVMSPMSGCETLPRGAANRVRVCRLAGADASYEHSVHAGRRPDKAVAPRRACVRATQRGSAEGF